MPDEDALKRLLKALEPASASDRAKLLAEKIKSEADVALLLEFPVGDHPLLEELKNIFWVDRPHLTPEEMGTTPFVTAIITRKELFNERPSLEVFRDANGINRRVIGCELVGIPVAEQSSFPYILSRCLALVLTFRWPVGCDAFVLERLCLSVCARTRALFFPGRGLHEEFGWAS